MQNMTEAPGVGRILAALRLALVRAIFCQSLHTARANLVKEPNKRRAEKPRSRANAEVSGGRRIGIPTS